MTAAPTVPDAPTPTGRQITRGKTREATRQAIEVLDALLGVDELGVGAEELSRRIALRDDLVRVIAADIRRRDRARTTGVGSGGAR